jgi:hypothetical protein
MQSQFHHLDVFYHTLLVMACLELVLEDPIHELCRPTEFEMKAEAALRKQGVRLPTTRSRPVETHAPNVDGIDLDSLRRFLTSLLDDRSKLLLKWLSLLHDVGKPATRCFVTEDGVAKVQFRGHESYSAFLAAKHIDTWFPEKVEQARLMHLIRKHHEHHQQVATYYPRGEPSDDPNSQELLKALRHDLKAAEIRGQLAKLRNRVTPGDANFVADFPLLLLHGYADAAACAGPDSRPELGDVAELNLALLAACARLHGEGKRAQTANRVGALLAEFNFRPGKEYGQLKKQLLAWAQSAAEPSDDEIRAEAKRIAAVLWPVS